MNLNDEVKDDSSVQNHCGIEGEQQRFERGLKEDEDNMKKEFTCKVIKVEEAQKTDR